MSKTRIKNRLSKELKKRKENKEKARAKRAKKMGGIQYLNYLNKAQKRKMKTEFKEVEKDIAKVIKVAELSVETLDVVLKAIEKEKIEIDTENLISIREKYSNLLTEVKEIQNESDDKFDAMLRYGELMTGLSLLEEEYADAMKTLSELMPDGDKEIDEAVKSILQEHPEEVIKNSNFSSITNDGVIDVTPIESKIEE